MINVIHNIIAAFLASSQTISRQDNVKKTIISLCPVKMSLSTDRRPFPERFTIFELSYRKVVSMFVHPTISVHTATTDAGKVRLGGFAPGLATKDTSKVRLGGFAPALATADASKVRMGGFAPTLATADAGKVRLGGFAPAFPAQC
jgi:hypothetical protein